jgi:hypothetical protein
MLYIYVYDDLCAKKSSLVLTLMHVDAQIGDPVVFKVATNLRAARDALRVQSLAAQQGARRATQVSLVRHKGWVAAIKAAYGFIEYPPQAINVAKARPTPDLPVTQPLTPDPPPLSCKPGI